MRQVITEQDVPAGGTLRVSKGTIFTPSARDLARERGVAIEEVDPGAQAVPDAARRTLAIGADHGGFAMKQALAAIAAAEGWKIRDVGVFEEKAVDYPDIAHEVARLVASGQAEAGIIVDGAGIGSAMAANKVPGIRAALCYDKASAKNSREHNHANVLTLGGRLLTFSQGEEVMRTWLATPHGGGRHQKRIDKITEIERKYSAWDQQNSNGS